MEIALVFAFLLGVVAGILFLLLFTKVVSWQIIETIKNVMKDIEEAEEEEEDEDDNDDWYKDANWWKKKKKKDEE